METIPQTRLTQLTKADLRNAATPAIFRQSERFHQQQAVTIQDFDYASVKANVRDQYSSYYVSIKETSNGQLNTQCSCYSRQMPCVHTYATLFAVLDELQQLHAAPAQPPSWEDYLNDLPKLREPEALNRDVQTMKLLFFIELKPKKWQLHPAPTYIKKSGELGRRSRLQFDYDGELRGAEASPAEIKAIQTIKQRLRASGYSSSSYNAYNSGEQFEFDYGEEAGYIFDMLADSALYLENHHAAPQPLRVINSPSQLFFELRNGLTGAGGQPAYQFFPQIQVNGQPEKFDENYRVLASRPFWVLKNEKLLRLQDSFPANYLMPFTRKGYELQIPQEQVSNFLQNFVPHLKHNIKLVLPENLSLQTARELTGRRLYLSEKNETLSVELRFVYGEIEVAALSRQDNSLTNSSATDGQTNTLWRVERDYPAEAAVHEAMVASGLKLDESLDFYAPVKEPVTWIFDELPKLAAADFEIFGEEALKTHRVNRHQLNVKVAVSSEIDWFDLNMEIDFGGIMLTLANLKQAVRHQNNFVKLADGSLARLPEEWEKRFRHFFNFAQVDGEKGGAQIASAHAMLIDALFDEVTEKQYDDQFKKRVGKLRDFKGIAAVPVPENLQGTLRPYQQAGLNWMGFLQEYGFNGCLADDMGLGKTIQTLAFLLREKSLNGHAAPGPEGKRGKNQATTSLIVAPLSVLFNWEKECAKFSPDLKLLIHHGLDREKAAAHFTEYDIVLTSYATMRLDIEFFKDFAFHYVILDESQNIKNPISQTAKAATILQSKHRLVLTGTPVENNTSELWSQFSFLNPGMLGTLHYFQSAFSVPIERHNDEAAANLLRKMIAPFLLRRTKDEVVKELPPKSEQIYYCEMTDSQKKYYNQVRDQYRAEIMNVIDTTGMQDARFKVLQGLTKLRQLACHPRLIDETSRRDSGKFEAFFESLQEIVAGGHKVLVFSQFVRMLKLIAEDLKKEKIKFEVLTGATRDRETCVKNFQEDPATKVFLISLKAGGLGLNLTAADYVMIYDPWWNPAAERQAADRAHRIGQTKNVFVYKMITRDTVEEKILELQKRKENLVSQLITTDAGVFKHLTAEDIRGLFS